MVIEANQQHSSPSSVSSIEDGQKVHFPFPSPTDSVSSLFCARKQREFIPDAKKDISYWDRRRRNNEAAKRSREKRRINDMMLEKRVIQLSRDNHILRAQVTAVFKRYGISAETLIDADHVLATLPSEEQLLAMSCSPINKRSASPTPMPLQQPSPLDVMYRTYTEPYLQLPLAVQPQEFGLKSPSFDISALQPMAKLQSFLTPKLWETQQQQYSDDALNLSSSSSSYGHNSDTEEKGYDLSTKKRCSSNYDGMPHKLRFKYQTTQQESCGIKQEEPDKEY